MSTSNMGRDESAPFGHLHGFWKGSGQGLPSKPHVPRLRMEDSEWDPAWICERNTKVFEKLPERNLARQHGGWGSLSEDEVLTDASQDSRSPSTVGNGIEAASATYFPYPTTSIPPPCIDFDFRVSIRFDDALVRAAADGGSKPVELTRAVGGSWSGTFGSGVVVAGGYYLDKAVPNGQGAQRVNGAFRLQGGDDDSAVQFEMRIRGSLSGPPDVLDPLELSENKIKTDPRRYSYRMFISMTTAEERLAETVNAALWIGSGIWYRNELVIDAYRVV